MKFFRVIFLLSQIFLLFVSNIYPDEFPAIPKDIYAFDTPNDNGSSITLVWSISEDDGNNENDVVEYMILRGNQINNMKVVGSVFAGSTKYEDTKLSRKNKYYYIIRVKDRSGNFSDSAVIGPISPVAQWFNSEQAPTAIGIIIFSGILIFFIYFTKRGGQIFVRRIPGLDAIDEAIGRATEMGKSILYVSGTGSMRNVATIASINILSRIARKAAENGSPLIIPCSDPVVMNIEREVVKNAHIDAGRLDSYRQDNIFFITEEQFAYAAAVDGIIMRERPAAIFYMGLFQAESLIFGEVGNSIGAIQIAGTDSITQIPFFITSCDYTLMGEELYAASAYVSREPLLLGSLKGQDIGKLLIIALIIIGAVMQMVGFHWFINVFRI
ncbi:MAG: DUF6754 domain-containing protein [bacterium]